MRLPFAICNKWHQVSLLVLCWLFCLSGLIIKPFSFGFLIHKIRLVTNHPFSFLLQESNEINYVEVSWGSEDKREMKNPSLPSSQKHVWSPLHVGTVIAREYQVRCWNVSYMRRDTSYEPCSPAWESWASTQLSEANQHQHRSNMLFQSHPTNSAAPEVLLHGCCQPYLWHGIPVGRVRLKLWCQTHLWGVVSLTKLRAGRGIGKRVIWHGVKPACCSLLTSRIILLGILSLLKPASDSETLTAKALKRGGGPLVFPCGWLSWSQVDWDLAIQHPSKPSLNSKPANDLPSNQHVEESNSTLVEFIL